MRVLFVANRLHSNQYGAIHALTANGHEVRYLVERTSSTENQNVLRPLVLDGGLLTKLMQARRCIREFKPDLLIVKELPLLHFLIVMIGRLSIPRVLFSNQAPLFVEGGSGSLRKRLKILLRKTGLIPRVRVTPVLGPGDERSDNHSYYLPFVVVPSPDAEQREYFRLNRINILSVAKVGLARKNHLLLLEAFRSLQLDFPMHLTLIGDLAANWETELAQILGFATRHNLRSRIRILTEVPHIQVMAEYARSDLFVLASDREPAAVSPLEAMSRGLPVVCSDANGTRHMVKEGVNGSVFATNDVSDLTMKMRQIIEDRSRLVEMGRNSVRIAQDEFSPAAYIDHLMKALTAQSKVSARRAHPRTSGGVAYSLGYG